MGGYGVKLEILLADLPVSELRSTQTRRRSSSPVAPLMVSVPSRSILAGPRILFSFTAMRIRQSVDGMGNQMPRLVCRSLGGETDKLSFRLMENILLAGAQHVVWRRLAVP